MFEILLNNDNQKFVYKFEVHTRNYFSDLHLEALSR